jgi:hypothetical protein
MQIIQIRFRSYMAVYVRPTTRPRSALGSTTAPQSTRDLREHPAGSLRAGPGMLRRNQEKTHVRVAGKQCEGTIPSRSPLKPAGCTTPPKPAGRPHC